MNYQDSIEYATSLYPDLDVGGLDSHLRERANDWKRYQDAFTPTINYLKSLPIRSSYPRRAAHSYGLKHDVEHITEQDGLRVYVPNGVLIAALINLDIPFKRDGINVITKISSRDRRRY